MSKPIYVIVSLVIFSGNTAISLAQSPEIEQSQKEAATGQSKTPWKTKNLPADAVTPSSSARNPSSPVSPIVIPESWKAKDLSPEKIDSSVEVAPKPVGNTGNDGFVPGWHRPHLFPADVQVVPSSPLNKNPDKNVLDYHNQVKDFHQSLAADEQNAKETTSWHGHLISANSEMACKSYSNCFDFLNKYDKKTALAPKSRAKGYLLYVNDKWYKLDKHGNTLAIKAIQKSIKSKGFYVAVNGKLKGNTIVVDNLVEIIDTPGGKASAPMNFDDNKLQSTDKVRGHLLGK
jgi:hypothetical protein